MCRHRPTPDELHAAFGRTVPDLLIPDLNVLFCGINPGLYSAAVKHHFARPGNRFWPALNAAGFTPRLVHPWEEGELLDLHLGITNIVARATASAAELSPEELCRSARSLLTKVRRFQPRFLAVLGVGAYRQAFQRPRATIGRQEESIGNTNLWVLPNPSGLNASYQLPDLVRQFRELRRAVEQ